MDKNYKYVQKETTGYYARIVCTSAQHGLDFGVGESPSNPFYVKFSSDESRHSSYGTRLQVKEMYLKKPGLYLLSDCCLTSLLVTSVGRERTSLMWYEGSKILPSHRSAL